MRRPAAFPASLALLAISAAAPSAFAYQEAHLRGDDVRVTVDFAGHAQIEHALTYRVTSGTLKQVELNGLEAGASIDTQATVTPEDGQGSIAQVEAHGDHGLRITMSEPKGLSRGTYVVKVRYGVDFVQARAIVLDGAMWRLTWTAPIANEGYDAARVTFDLPAAPTEPRAASTDATTIDDGHVSTLRRTAAVDELEISRPRVARGEAPTWALRIDPKAFPEVKDASLRPPPRVPPPPPDRLRMVGAIAALFLLALGFAVVVREKSRRVERACASRGVAPRPLTPFRAPLRALFAGIAFAAGVSGEVLGAPTLGAVAILTAMALTTYRAPHARTSVRGPGKWLALAPNEAFVTAAPSCALDAGTRAGRIALMFVALAAIGVAFALGTIDVEYRYIVVLDLLALVPIFFTGTALQLPQDAANANAAELAKMHRALHKDEAIRVAPWARLPLGSDRADELRLLVQPRASMPGLTGIEIGLAWQRTANGYAPATEVLVRVHEATAAAARMTALTPRLRAVTGRKPDERVLRVIPALPGRRAALALVRRLARELVDRRMTIAAKAPGAWGGVERRIPPNERAKTAAEDAKVVANEATKIASKDAKRTPDASAEVPRAVAAA